MICFAISRREALPSPGRWKKSMQRSRIVPLVGEIDAWLALAFLALTCIGVIMVYSASIADSYRLYNSPYYIAEREVIWAVIGFAAMIGASRVHYSRWDRIALPFIAVSGFLLAVVLIPHIGTVSNGARRWFTLGSLSLQPSELVKLALVVYMAAWLRTKGEHIAERQTFVAFSIIVGAAFSLIFLEPDLGTAMVLALTMGAMYFVAGANLLYLAGSGTGAAMVAWILIHHSSYESGRLLAFMNPWKYSSGAGYHTIQVLLALGSGGFFGRGLGNSTQKYLLPAPHTDSILAVIGEEWGIFGSLVVLFLFVIIAYRGIKIASNAHDT